jgi:hypothetical protein
LGRGKDISNGLREGVIDEEESMGSAAAVVDIVGVEGGSIVWRFDRGCGVHNLYL